MKCVEWIILGIFGIFFIKDFLLMPFAIGEAKNKKDYWRTIRIGIILIALIFAYAYLMG
jgi:hypothetical protein